MKISLSTVALGPPSYLKHTLPFIEQYCKKHSYHLDICREPTAPNVKPGWFKLKAFERCPDADMLIICDCDLIFLPHAPPIHEILDPSKINICDDMVIEYKGKRYDANFKYNTGLVGVSRKFETVFDDIYDKHRFTPRVCWEQQFVNDAIAEQNLEVNVLPLTWNFMIRFVPETCDPTYQDVYVKHISCGKNAEQRLTWAEEHYKYFFENNARCSLA